MTRCSVCLELVGEDADRSTGDPVCETCAAEHELRADAVAAAFMARPLPDQEHYMTSITDLARGRDWTPPPTNKVALDVTLGDGDSVSLTLIGPRLIEESVVVHIAGAPGEQFGWECAICQEVSGLAYGNDDDAQVALHNHKCAAVG